MRSRSAGGPLQDAPEERFVLTEPGATEVEAVHVGGVDEHHAGVEGCLEHALGVVDVGMGRHGRRNAHPWSTLSATGSSARG
jgi:hypothetical protein